MNTTAIAPPPPRTDKSSSTRRNNALLLAAIDWFIPVATVGLIIFFGLSSASFFSSANLFAVLTQNATLFIVAVVVAILLMAGFVDLSVGSVLAVSGVVAGFTFNDGGLLPGLIAGLAVGLLCGVINGVLIGLWGLSPIVVTLGMLAAARGVAQFLAPTSLYGFPDDVNKLGAGGVFGISYLSIIAAVICIVAVVVMNKLSLGRQVIAIGVNSRAAYLVGIRVKTIIVALYVAVGLAVGLSGVLQAARLDSVPSGTLGVGFEVDVLTAVLVGGIPFTGGRGSILRVLLGVLLIAILRNGLTLLNYGPDTAGIFTGVVLVAAAGLESLRDRIRKNS